MKHVNAYPFVGKDYEKGFLNSGKKVLILGHSHYDADSAGCTSVRDNELYLKAL